MSQDPSEASASITTLIEQLSNLLRRWDLGYSERFEEDAERFYRETGFMAPGKSQPLEMEGDYTRRQEAWDKWTPKLGDEAKQIVRDAIALLIACRSAPQETGQHTTATCPICGEWRLCAAGCDD